VPLTAHPQYAAFCRRYAGDIVRFATEVIGLEPTHQQVDMFRAVAPSRSRTAVASGHGTGKTSAIGVIILWHMLCFENSWTLLTANDMDQVKATLWKELNISHARMAAGPYGWLADYVELRAGLTAHVLGFQRTWMVECKTANDKTANKLAGRHAVWFLVIADESSSIPDGVLVTLKGALTQQHNRMLMTSQYTRNAGFFHRSQNEWSRRVGGEWVALRFSSIDSPLVDDAALQSDWDEFDDDERRVRILGLPPLETGKHMMLRSTAEAMYQRGQIIGDDEPWGWFILGDIASGEGLRDKSAIVVARVIGYGDRGLNARRVEVGKIPIHTNNIRSNRLAGHIAEEIGLLPGAVAILDAGGLGVNVCQDLEDMGKQVHRVLWGEPCFQNRNRRRYLNLRAQAMHQAARAAKEGRLSIRTGAHRNAMIAQSSRVPKLFNHRNRLVVPPKGALAWEGQKSPDLWDAVCFAFLEATQYAPVGGAGRTAEDIGRAAEQQAEALFSDVA
jgi:hypothetical protein